jgi:hypothetical protein
MTILGILYHPIPTSKRKEKLNSTLLYLQS